MIYSDTLINNMMLLPRRHW